MPNWKKLIVSGSSAELTGLTLTGNANISGNITNATWNGDVIADSYLSTNTAHLSGTQTFTGIKTFNARITAANTLTAESGIKFTGLAGSTSAKALMIDSDGIVGTRGLSTQAFSNYTLPAGSSSTRGGFKIGYTESGKNYPVEVSSEKMYVNVPWSDTNTQLSTSEVREAFSAGSNVSITNGVISATDTNTDTNTVTSIRRDNTGTYRTGNINLVGGTNVTISETSAGVFNISSTDTNTDTNTTYLLKATQVEGSNTDPYIKLDANSGTDDLIQLRGGGATSITRDNDGQITISSTDTNTNTTYSTATSSTLGLVKIGYTESGKNYPVELSSGKMFVNVPWSDTNTVTKIRRDNTGTYRTGNINLVGGTNVSISETSAGVFNISSTDTNTDTNTFRGIRTTNGDTETSLEANETLNLKAGTNVSISESEGLVTFSSTDTNTQLSTSQVRSKISGTGLISYNSSTGVISTTANNYSLPAGSSSTRGGFKIGYTESGKNYPVEVSSEKMYVNVPWTDTNTDTNTFRTVKVRGETTNTLGSTETLEFRAGSNVSLAEADGVVTITSTDTNTNTTYSADGNYGLTLSGTTFRLEDDRRRNSSSTDIKTGNTHDYTWYDADVGIRWYVAGAEDMRLQNGGTLQVDGDVVAYSTTISDERLKDNVTTIENPLDKIKALRGVEYDWNAGSRKGKRDLGLIAQEVEKVIPNIVHEHEQPFLNDDEDDKTLYKTVDYEKMVAVLIEGMKEQQSQIDELKSEINQLKGKV